MEEISRKDAILRKSGFEEYLRMDRGCVVILNEVKNLAPYHRVAQIFREGGLEEWLRMTPALSRVILSRVKNPGLTSREFCDTLIWQPGRRAR